MQVRRIVLLMLVHTTLASIASTKKDSTTTIDAKTTMQLSNSTNNSTAVTKKLAALNEIDIGKLKTRRKKERSTSSSSGEIESGKSNRGGSSLGISSKESSEGSEKKKNKYLKYQNFDARGCRRVNRLRRRAVSRESDEYGERTCSVTFSKRRWHRKCTPCPEDMVKKWRDPSIEWICGGYQRARRSFKSKCMMHYRNCQDGTMFVKIHDHRCENSTPVYPRGRHFFYDYKVILPGDTSGSDETETSLSEESSSSISF